MVSVATEPSPATGKQSQVRKSASPTTHLDFNRITDEQFQIAADHMNLENDIQLLLRSPYRELVVQVPVRMDDGRLEIFHGYRFHHNGVRGPYKGGLRYHMRWIWVRSVRSPR